MSKSAHIFKEQEAKDIFMGVKGFNFGSIEAQARSIIDAANRQAEQLLARARAEVERMREEIRGQEFESARKEGSDKGFKEGRQQGLGEGKEQAYSQVYVELKKDVGDTPKVIKQLIEGIESHRNELTQEAHTDILSLGFAIGERVARVAIEKDPSVVQKILTDAIDLVLNRNTLDISVNPTDLAAIEEFIPEVKKNFSDVETLRLHTDPKLSRGSVRVKTGRGTVGIHVDELIDAIAQELLGMGAADALDRIMEGLGKELAPVEMKTDLTEEESILADALSDDIDEEEVVASSKDKTGVFMQDSFLDKYKVEEEDDAEVDAPIHKPQPGSLTRVLTAEMLGAASKSDDHVSMATAKVQASQGGIDDLFSQALGETGALPAKPAELTTDDLRNIDTKVLASGSKGTPTIHDILEDGGPAQESNASMSLDDLRNIETKVLSAGSAATPSADDMLGSTGHVPSLADLEDSAEDIGAEYEYESDDNAEPGFGVSDVEVSDSYQDNAGQGTGLDAFGDPFADHESDPASLSIMSDIGDPLAPSNFSASRPRMPQPIAAPEAPENFDAPEEVEAELPSFDSSDFGPESGSQKDAQAFGMSDSGTLSPQSGEAELDLDSALAELNALAQEAKVSVEGPGGPSGTDAPGGGGGGLDDALAELDMLSAEAGLGFGESDGLNPWDEDNSDLNTGSIMGDSFLDDLMGGK